MCLPLGGGVFTMFSEIMIKIAFVAMGFLFCNRKCVFLNSSDVMETFGELLSVMSLQTEALRPCKQVWELGY